MESSDPFAAFDQARKELKKKSRQVRLLLVDLVGSTGYKTRNLDINWVTRLKTFYDTVMKAVGGKGKCKLLGDGILVSFFDDKISAGDIVTLAQKILTEIEEPNKELRGEHSIRVRIVLNCGTVYPFDDDDPQGTPVDKLFRMEKFVPDGCIGLTEEFAKEAGIAKPPIAYLQLKGLPEPKSHGLVVIGHAMTDELRRKLTDTTRFSALWSQPGEDVGAEVNLVGGYIQAETSHVQMGDVNAKLLSLLTLAALGYADRTELFDSSSFPSDVYQQNIISIGGPCNNSLTENLLAGLPVGFEITDDDEDATPLIIKGGQSGRFEAIRDDEGRLTKDWGLFVRMQNPSNRSRRVIIGCGIESPGCEGIIRAFTPDNQHFSELMDKVASLGSGKDGDPLPDFFCVMPFRVEANSHATLPNVQDQTRLIIPL